MKRIKLPRLNIRHGELSLSDCLGSRGDVRPYAIHPHSADLKRITSFLRGPSQSDLHPADTKGEKDTLGAIVAAASSYRRAPSAPHLASHPYVKYHDAKYGRHMGHFLKTSRVPYRGYMR